MSGIISIYIPTGTFNSSIYVPNQDMTQISLVGTVNGNPLVAYTTSGAAFNCQLQANFTSGSEEPQVSEQPKKNKFSIKPPQKNQVKSPPKVPLEAQVPIGLKQNLYKKPENIVAQLPIDKQQPSGTVTGSYTFNHAPWPSNWNVYLLINYQIQYAGTNVYEFYMASHPDDMTDPYDAYFSATDFKTIGQTTTTPSPSTFNVAPRGDHFFNFTPV